MLFQMNYHAFLDFATYGLVIIHYDRNPIKARGSESMYTKV